MRGIVSLNGHSNQDGVSAGNDKNPVHAPQPGPPLPQPDPSMWGSCARSYLKKLRKDLDVPGLLLALLYTPESFYNNPCGCNNPNSG